MPDRMLEDMPDRMPDRMPARMPEDMPDKVPECLPDRMPADLPENMPEDMLDRMPDGMPEDLPDNMPEDMPDRMPDGMPEDMPEHMPEDMPEDMPEHLPEDMPEHLPEDMPGRMPEHLPEDMPEHLPEDMPGRMPEDMPDRMPDRMPENMSDRMPEDLPVTKCINVMVGITRSKVILHFFPCVFFPNLISLQALPWLPGGQRPLPDAAVLVTQISLLIRDQPEQRILCEVHIICAVGPLRHPHHAALVVPGPLWFGGLFEHLETMRMMAQVRPTSCWMMLGIQAPEHALPVGYPEDTEMANDIQWCLVTPSYEPCGETKAGPWYFGQGCYESWGALCRHLLAAIPNIASVVIQQIAADTLFKQAKSLQSVFLNVSEAKRYLVWFLEYAGAIWCNCMAVVCRFWFHHLWALT